MKKSLVALSVLAAFAGVAHAQSSVTMYGVVDMSYQQENNNGKKINAIDSGEQSGSRLGFKGEENLGGNLKAIFQLEAGILADTGASQGGLLFGRQAFVGLAGDFGAVKLGRQYTPIFIATDSVDVFDAGMTSGHAGQSTSTAGLLGMFGTPFRTNNTVNYSTTNLNGFSAAAAYSAGEVAANVSASRAIGLSGTYAAGPVLATVAYDKANDLLGNSSKVLFVGGVYDFTVAKLHAAYGTTKTDAAYTLASVITPANNKELMVGTTVPFGKAAFLASYTRVTNNLVPTAGKSNQAAVGATYTLSKRTNLYTSYSRITNGANANVGANTNMGAFASAAGATDSLFNVGIRHSF